MAAKRGEWTKLGKDKLLSSGLTSSQGAALGMYEIPSATMMDKRFPARPVLVIPYLDFDKKPLSAHPHWPNFYRLRFLDNPPVGFDTAAGEKEQRYLQPFDSGVCAYFPALVDWKNIVKDPEYDIIITEGELKAAAACAVNFPTIGLGGVWNFRSSKEGLWFLPELEAVKWAKRNVFICFDSDYLSKPQVCLAINGLCEELQERGANIKLLALPEGEGEGAPKVGLDDYLVEHAPEELADLLGVAAPLGMTRSLWQMNNEVVYVEDPGMVIVEESGQKMSADMFKGHSRWATAIATETRVSVKGDVLRDKVPAAPVWLRWPLRRSVRKLTYAPGLPKITDAMEFNQWPGWGVKPKKGDVKPWLKLTKFIFQGAEPGVLDYFYDWLAYPIQNPGVKLFVGVVIHGQAQGTGKTLIGYTMGRIYGQNFMEIDDDDLEETFWAENKQFILGDEITGKDNRAYMNTLKRLITKETTSINIKFVPQFVLPNCMNFIFTSNHADSFFLEDKDRRFLVVEVVEDPLPDEFYAEYDKWYKGDGASYLMQWLLDRKIAAGFNPSARAPSTSAKDRMILATQGDLGTWVRELKDFPEQVLYVGALKHTRDLYSSKELLKMYERDFPSSRVTAVGLGRKLAQAGFIQVLNGNPIKGPDGKHERFWAVRNISHWKKIKDQKSVNKDLNKAPVKS